MPRRADHPGSRPGQREYIPTLCYLEGLSAVGACRLCIVEVSGVGRLLPACTTPVQDGMSVTTNSEKLTRYRRMAIEFLFSERNHYCAVCVSNGHCELQAMAQKLGVTSWTIPYSYPRCQWTCRTSASCWTTTAASCAPAVCGSATRWRARMCWMSVSRGIHSMISCDLNRPWGQAQNCTSCGKCVQVCPTGALAEKGWAVEEMTKRVDNIDLARRQARRQSMTKKAASLLFGWMAVPAATCRCSISTKR